MPRPTKIREQQSAATTAAKATTTQNGQSLRPPAYGVLSVDGPVIQTKKKEEDRKKKKGKPIQPKLMIGQAGDKYEREADAVADQVVRMSPETLQAKRPEEEEKKIRSKPLASRISPLQADSSPTAASSSLESRLSAAKGGGQPLPHPTMSFMERAFGTDFSGVRVHTDPQAVRMNEELGAKAFTLGSDVYFNKGQFQPETTAGKWLLGHELGHVVQRSFTTIRSNEDIILNVISQEQLTQIRSELFVYDDLLDWTNNEIEEAITILRNDLESGALSEAVNHNLAVFERIAGRSVDSSSRIGLDYYPKIEKEQPLEQDYLKGSRIMAEDFWDEISERTAERIQTWLENFDSILQAFETKLTEGDETISYFIVDSLLEIVSLEPLVGKYIKAIGKTLINLLKASKIQYGKRILFSEFKDNFVTNLVSLRNNTASRNGEIFAAIAADSRFEKEKVPAEDFWKFRLQKYDELTEALNQIPRKAEIEQALINDWVNISEGYIRITYDPRKRIYYSPELRGVKFGKNAAKIIQQSFPSNTTFDELPYPIELEYYDWRAGGYIYRREFGQQDWTIIDVPRPLGIPVTIHKEPPISTKFRETWETELIKVKKPTVKELRGV